MSSKQNKERLSSASRRDGYFSYVWARDSEVQKTTLLSGDSQRARSCSPCSPTPTAWSQQCKTPPPSVSTPGAPTTCNVKTSASALNLSATIQLRQKNQNNHSYGYYFGIDCNRSSKFNGNKNHDNKSKPKQNLESGSGLERYIHIKRKLARKRPR